MSNWYLLQLLLSNSTSIRIIHSFFSSFFLFCEFVSCSLDILLAVVYMQLNTILTRNKRFGKFLSNFSPGNPLLLTWEIINFECCQNDATVTFSSQSQKKEYFQLWASKWTLRALFHLNSDLSLRIVLICTIWLGFASTRTGWDDILKPRS